MLGFRPLKKKKKVIFPLLFRPEKCIGKKTRCVEVGLIWYFNVFD